MSDISKEMLQVSKTGIGKQFSLLSESFIWSRHALVLWALVCPPLILSTAGSEPGNNLMSCLALLSSALVLVKQMLHA